MLKYSSVCFYLCLSLALLAGCADDGQPAGSPPASPEASSVFSTALPSASPSIQDIAAPRQNTGSAILMVDNRLYCYTGEAVEADIEESDVLGKITSTVSRTEVPTENGQANIPFKGAPYARYGDDMIVFMNDGWILFRSILGPDVYPASLMVDEQLYYYTGEAVETAIEEGDAIGKIAATVPQTEVPKENGQANIPFEDAPYARYGGDMIVFIDDKWILFKSISGPNTCPPALMLDGQLYYFTGEAVETDMEERDATGRIVSIVAASEMPKENGQANIPFQSAPYAKYGDDLIVFMNDEWMLFEKRGSEDGDRARLP